MKIPKRFQVESHVHRPRRPAMDKHSQALASSSSAPTWRPWSLTGHKSNLIDASHYLIYPGTSLRGPETDSHTGTQRPADSRVHSPNTPSTSPIHLSRARLCILYPHMKIRHAASLRSF